MVLLFSPVLIVIVTALSLLAERRHAVRLLYESDLFYAASQQFKIAFVWRAVFVISHYLVDLRKKLHTILLSRPSICLSMYLSLSFFFLHYVCIYSFLFLYSFSIYHIFITFVSRPHFVHLSFFFIYVPIFYTYFIYPFFCIVIFLFHLHLKNFSLSPLPLVCRRGRARCRLTPTEKVLSRAKEPHFHLQLGGGTAFFFFFSKGGILYCLLSSA